MSSADTAAEAAVETDAAREAVVDDFRRLLGDALLDVVVDPGRDITLRVAISAWRQAFHVARHELQFGYFEFLSAIDWMPSPFGRYEDATVDDDEPAEIDLTPRQGVAGGETRFQVFGRVFDVHRRHFGVTIKADVPDDAFSVETLIPVFPGANWHEREAHEMFGIGFDGHPYLEPLYLPGGFEGHPLRKDYPLVARIVKPWPGIVDVEPMPGGDDEEEGEES